MRFSIDPDITRAATLPGAFYCDPEVLARQRERIFARAWHLAAGVHQLETPGACVPALLGEEPVVFTRDAAGALHCVSNVCTHRANLVVNAPCNVPSLRCRYHGRRFGLDGRFHSMPEFEGARLPLRRRPPAAGAVRPAGPLLFASAAPAFALDELLAPVRARVGWLRSAGAVRDPAARRDYQVASNWALYCDNYLEGFHIPFVHPALSGALDYGAYRTELYPFGTLQVGVAAAGEDAFDPARRRHRRIAAYYFWLFPTRCSTSTRGAYRSTWSSRSPSIARASRYQTWVWDPRGSTGAGAGLDRVEQEDEEVVESVQQGVRSRLYRSGRYSPSRETGVHHFHRLLARFLE